jgi:hypothetical protein
VFREYSNEFCDAQNLHECTFMLFSVVEWIYIDVATFGLSWNFSSAENLESLSLQDRPQIGTIITQPASQPASPQSPTC